DDQAAAVDVDFGSITERVIVGDDVEVAGDRLDNQGAVAVLVEDGVGGHLHVVDGQGVVGAQVQGVGGGGAVADEADSVAVLGAGGAEVDGGPDSAVAVEGHDIGIDQAARVEGCAGGYVD